MTIKEFKEKLKEFEPDDEIFIEYSSSFYHEQGVEPTRILFFPYNRETEEGKKFKHIILRGCTH